MASRIPTFVTVPTDAERQGNFSALLAAGIAISALQSELGRAERHHRSRARRFPATSFPPNLLSPIALNYMKFYPEPNVTVGVGATGDE